MPLRVLDLDPQADSHRIASRLVLQEDLNLLFTRVVRLEQARGHVRCAPTADADDAGIPVVERAHAGLVHDRLRVVRSQSAIAGRGGRAYGRRLGWLSA